MKFHYVSDTFQFAHRWTAVLALICSACFADSSSDHTSKRAERRTEADGGAIAPKNSTPYRVIEVANGGAVRGRVEIDGDVPAASPGSVSAGASQTPCGVGATDESIQHTGTALSNVVVWVSDIRQGHALPIERRFEVVHENCRIAPRVQAAVVGSTVNVRNQDAMAYRLFAIRDGSDDTLAVFRMSDVGQVVPSERIAKNPALVALASDTHSWARAWIAVFDHPYFAVTKSDGTFRIESLPPGKYELKAWHERAQKVVDETFEVAPGKDATVDLKLRLK